ncbi:MAG: transcriptional repressor [Deltaproteobacteria bacterium]|nr:transcriptional repressor [Deltaproteobacteria bacterium]
MSTDFFYYKLVPKRTPKKLMHSQNENLARLISEAERYCAVQGTQLTQLRRLILETLAKAPGPMKAYDIIETLHQSGQRLTPSTVYRILDFFLQGGLVHRVNTLNAFVACTCAPEQEHSPLILVCPECQSTMEIDDDDLHDSIFSRLGALGYSVKGSSIEIQGVCPKCSKPGP